MGRWCFPDVILYGEDDYINGWVKQWNRLRVDGKSKGEKALEVFLAGIVALNAQEGIEPPRNDRKEKIQELRERKQRVAELNEIREETTPEEFVVWCQAHHEDPNIPYQLDMTVDHRIWLDRLLKDGQPYQVAVIKTKAEEEGFDDVIWHKIENYAARKRYKKVYGVWQKKP